MRFECNFGTLAAGKNAAAPAGTRFRIAILGDFSGHALAGQLDTGDALAARKPLKVDVDNLDDLIERMGIKLQLPLGDDGQTAGRRKRKTANAAAADVPAAPRSSRWTAN